MRRTAAPSCLDAVDHAVSVALARVAGHLGNHLLACFAHCEGSAHSVADIGRRHRFVAVRRAHGQCRARGVRDGGGGADLPFAGTTHAPLGANAIPRRPRRLQLKLGLGAIQQRQALAVRTRRERGAFILPIAALGRACARRQTAHGGVFAGIADCTRRCAGERLILARYAVGAAFGVNTGLLPTCGTRRARAALKHVVAVADGSVASAVIVELRHVRTGAVSAALVARRALIRASAAKLAVAPRW